MHLNTLKIELKKRQIDWCQRNIDNGHKMLLGIPCAGNIIAYVGPHQLIIDGINCMADKISQLKSEILDLTI